MNLPQHIQTAVDLGLLQVNEQNQVSGVARQDVETVFGMARLIEKIQPTTKFEGDDTKVVGPVPKLDKTPGRLRWLGRRELGADSRAVLEELGYDAGKIDKLTENGTVAEPKR